MAPTGKSLQRFHWGKTPMDVEASHGAHREIAPSATIFFDGRAAKEGRFVR